MFRLQNYVQIRFTEISEYVKILEVACSINLIWLYNWPLEESKKPSLTVSYLLCEFRLSFSSQVLSTEWDFNEPVPDRASL